MSRASDILRGRHCAPTGDERHRREMSAVADLLESVDAYIAWTEGDGHGMRGADLLCAVRDASSALERAIGESK